MTQVKLFRTGFIERDVNSWIEEMSNDPTFRVVDIKLARGQEIPIALVIYEIESEKEKEKRYEFGKKMDDIVNNGLVNEMDPFAYDWRDK